VVAPSRRVRQPVVGSSGAVATIVLAILTKDEIEKFSRTSTHRRLTNGVVNQPSAHTD
jgi:hypothetical protein